MGPRAVRRLEQKERARRANAALREASSPLTSPDRLLHLTQTWPDHPAIRETIARNPSTPPQVLGMLLADAPFAVARNPVLSLAPLEDPDFLHRPSPLALRRLLLQENVPSALLDMLPWHPDPIVAEAARGHVGRAGELSSDVWEDALLPWIEALPVVWPQALAELLALRLVPFRAHWAPRTDGIVLPRPELGRLSRDERRALLDDTLKRARTADGTLEKFLAVLSSWADPSASARALSPEERLAAVLNHRITRRQLEPRAQDSHRLVRAAARHRLAHPDWRFTIAPENQDRGGSIGR
jgi:hypothetical protein